MSRQSLLEYGTRYKQPSSLLSIQDIPTRAPPQPSKAKSSSSRPNYEAILGETDPYAVLGVSSKCDEAEIKRGFKAAALRYHPDRARSSADKDKAHRAFQLIAEAYALLGETKRRAEFDESRRQPRKTDPHDNLYDPQPPPYSHSPPPAATSFKSTFTPAAKPSRGQKQTDLRGIDPFILFERMFGGGLESVLASFAHDSFDDDWDKLQASRKSKHSSNLFEDDDPSWPSSKPRSIPGRRRSSAADELSAHPFFAGGMSTSPESSVAPRSNSGNFRASQSRSRTHISRDGHITMQKQDKRVQMRTGSDGSRSIVMESRSMSGSFGSGEMPDMFASFFGGSGFGGQQSIGDSPFGHHAIPPARARRGSFAAPPSMPLEYDPYVGIMDDDPHALTYGYPNQALMGGGMGRHAAIGDGLSSRALSLAGDRQRGMVPSSFGSFY